MSALKNISGRELIAKLKALGYEVTRQKGSHIRLVTQQNGEHHITIPDHDPLRIGTLSGVLTDIADHFGISKDTLIEKLGVK